MRRAREFQDISALPAGERMLWQGRPSAWGLAWRAFHIREVAIYFGLLMAWRLASSWSTSTPQEAIAYAAWLLVPAAVGIATLAALARWFASATRYTITSKRVLLQFGAALPMTMNIPLDKITNAALKTYSDGTGDIPLSVIEDGRRVSFALLWPHVRPWKLRFVQPMLRAIPDAATVAGTLSQALSGQPLPAAIAQQAVTSGSLGDAIAA